jgi:hypothetical protein
MCEISVTLLQIPLFLLFLKKSRRDGKIATSLAEGLQSRDTLRRGTLVPEALCEAKETRGEKEEPLVTSVANPTSTLDYV